MQFLTDSSFSIGFEIKDFDGARYFVPSYARHRPASQCILRDRYYEPRTHQLVAHLLKVIPGNIVHAGTFFGDMLPSFSRACGGSGTVYAFEPLLENYLLARLTVDYNRLANVVLFNSGLGDTLGPCRIARLASSGVHAGGASKVSESGDVSSSIVTLDSLGLTQLSILQLDVEGFELRALGGAHAAIAAHRPVVMIEDNERNCAPLLEGISYSETGRIPGLGIWCPDEKTNLADSISQFLANR